MDLYEEIDQINRDLDLQIDVQTITEIYGPGLMDSMYDMCEDVVKNIFYLFECRLGSTVTDICNRFAPILLEDPQVFEDKVDAILERFGEDYKEAIAEDLSVWEELM
jgi:hypothetical protein